MNRREQKQLARTGKPIIKLHTLGATGAVTGSLNLIEFIRRDGITRVLLDVGLTVENEMADFQNRLPAGVTASDIDFVIISHAHLDHSGYLPKLIKEGFKGPAYVPPATADLLAILFPDSGYLQEQAARRHNERAVKADKGGIISVARRLLGGAVVRERKPLYTEAEARAALSSLVTIDYDKRLQITPDFAVTFTEAGHILGAAVVNLEIGQGADKRRVCFTGNIGRPDISIIREAAPLMPADYLITEATYGDRVHPKVDRLEMLAGIINGAYERARKKNGAILIPAFAVGRAQAVLYDLRQLMAEGRIPTVPVYVDGPMTIRATAIHRKHSELFNEKTLKLVRAGIDPFTTPRQTETMQREASQALDLPQSEPFIIVGSSGMANGGRIVNHFLVRLMDPENTVVFVGYQGTGTLGQALVGCKIDPRNACATEVKIYGKVVPVRATIEFIGAYSGHGDGPEFLSLFSRLPRKPKKVFIEHGTPSGLAGMKSLIEKVLGWDCVIPKMRDVFILD